MAFPSLTGESLQARTRFQSVVVEIGQLPHGHAVTLGNRIKSAEVLNLASVRRPQPGLRQWDLLVQHNDFDPLCSRRLHTKRHGCGVGVVARADILNVENERIDFLQVLGAG